MRPLSNESAARIQVAELAGLWRRELLIDIDGSTDAASEVHWLQGVSSFIDLRQPADRPDFAAVRCEADLTLAHHEWLKHQAGFAGTLVANGDFFEWRRSIDLQPPHSSPDAGTLAYQGELLIEKGWYESYVEHWRLQPDTSGANWAVQLQSDSGARALLIRVGGRFGWARQSGSPATVSAVGSHARGAQQLSVEIALGSVVAPSARARSARTTHPRRAGLASATPRWLIEKSSIPYRAGTELSPRVLDHASAGPAQIESGSPISTRDVSLAGHPIQLDWNVLSTEGAPTL